MRRLFEEEGATDCVVNDRSSDTESTSSGSGSGGGAKEVGEGEKWGIGPLTVRESSGLYEYKGGQLVLEQNKSKGLSHSIWPCCISLADFTIELESKSPGFWKGKQVLEVGCGCGLAGLALASMGAHVVLTDLPKVLDLARRNCERNQEMIARANGSAEAKVLDWLDCSSGDDERPAGFPQFDVVIAADCVYYKDLFVPLLKVLKLFSRGGGGTDIYLASIKRWKVVGKFFKRSFTSDEVFSQPFDSKGKTYSKKIHLLKRRVSSTVT